MEWLKTLGAGAFLFFLIKGLLWIFLFVLLYMGFIDREKLNKIKSSLTFIKRKPK